MYSDFNDKAEQFFLQHTLTRVGALPFPQFCQFYTETNILVSGELRKTWSMLASLEREKGSNL